MLLTAAAARDRRAMATLKDRQRPSQGSKPMLDASSPTAPEGVKESRQLSPRRKATQTESRFFIFATFAYLAPLREPGLSSTDTAGLKSLT
jgi:hypothetical protein